MHIANHSLYSASAPRFLARLRYQVFIGLFAVVALPQFLYIRSLVPADWSTEHVVSTIVGSVAAFGIALFLFRRVAPFPGVSAIGQTMPSVLTGYGLVLTAYLGFRFEYSRLLFFFSFLGCLSFFFLVGVYLKNRKGQRFYIVPSCATSSLPFVPQITWVHLTQPQLPDDPGAVLIADLRADLGSEWESFIVNAAVAGHPVYHIKQIQESLTGMVEIEHLSENSFGSLLPNFTYLKVKRLVDIVAALLALPLVLLAGCVIAFAIKVDSPGPILFLQERRGYRGRVFKVIKFRTMVHHERKSEAERDQAITRVADERITRVGRVLRRTRIDELPQVWNILRGEMSWVGPRPEALALSDWYSHELPFYQYRHIVRPGITGWAQVHQGHVAALEDVFAKLHYDFFYIKNFSAWLDVLIVCNTINIVMTGRGAK